ncbi:hypothetical protein KY314_01375 [Candidatus Woesearchaeota archaeon]|nr:hypothetical protein [Candidatus Woesearchaeota archaeon]
MEEKQSIEDKGAILDKLNNAMTNLKIMHNSIQSERLSDYIAELEKLEKALDIVTSWARANLK